MLTVRYFTVSLPGFGVNDNSDKKDDSTNNTQIGINEYVSGTAKISNEKYGYPFVGEHWIPHFTVGSLELNPDIIINDIKPLFNFPKKIQFNNLSMYVIDVDSHTLIKSIQF